MPVEQESALICQSCERPVSADAAHCPHCCGHDGQLGEGKRRAVIGSIVGLMAGGIAAAVYSSFAGPERTSAEVVFGIALGAALTGLVLGILNKPKNV